MGLVTLASGKQVVVTPANVGDVSNEAVNAARQQSVNNSNTFTVQDEQAIRGAINQAASDNTTPVAPTDYSIFGGGPNTLTGQLGEDFSAGSDAIGTGISNAASTISKYAGATVQGIGDGLQGLQNQLTLYIVLGIAGLALVAYIAFKER